MNNEDSISQIELKADKVLKQLKTLNVAKSCGPDNWHPGFLNECAEKIYLPLTDFFRISVSDDEVPEDWKQANNTCIFK